jgi:hypothetical protein
LLQVALLKSADDDEDLIDELLATRRFALLSI